MNKGGSPVFHQDSKTIVADRQQLKSAICAVAISSTHACQIVRQSSLLPASRNQVQPPSSLPGSMCHLRAASNLQAASQEATPLPLPAMILRLRWGVVNPKRAEIRSTNNTAAAARSEISVRISASVLYQKIQSSTWRLLKLYD